MDEEIRGLAMDAKQWDAVGIPVFDLRSPIQLQLLQLMGVAVYIGEAVRRGAG